MKMVIFKCRKMSLMDITKIFSLLKPNEDDEALAEARELHVAVAMDNAEHLYSLLSDNKYKKYINTRSGWGIPVTPLRLAASKGSLQCLKILLDHGAEVDSLDVKAQTPLFTAVSAGHLDCVRELLKVGANPGGSIYNNCSPVLIAAREGNASILRELLEYGAETNVRSRVPDWAASNTSSSGALYLSAVYGHLECFKLLLLYGADPDYNCTSKELLERIKNPKSVLEICLKHGCRTQFIQLLIDFGANVYLPNIEVNRSFPNHKAMELLLSERVNPRSLMSQSRLTIRKLLGQLGRRKCIPQLNIPSSMIRYLQHQTS
ncbi:ankyrin repeat and SOCS box protein 12-like [Bombina bombina]|uniref:ankyrin repeat and SOCS box protein 12-like n=1 Tax=Bombina bombina TaxID=8345 RepID=UPI00235A58A7|nr:ankyrin repeat and SOCS box protein 12-like [Bombina bombina]